MGPGINLVISREDQYISEIIGPTENFYQQYTRVQKKNQEVHTHLFMYICSPVCTYISIYKYVTYTWIHTHFSSNIIDLIIYKQP